MRQILWLLFLVSCLKLKEVNSEFVDLNDNQRQDLFKIYTHIALTEEKVLHEPVTPDKVNFFLYTKNNSENYIVIDPSNPTVLDNKDAKFVFIIHGWLEYRGKEWYEDLKNSFLSRDDRYYIIQVDWSAVSFEGYLLSSYSTKDIGDIIGKFIVGLHNNYSIPLVNFLVVGHSLGGQISGFVGKKVIELTKQKLPRIVALDPAGPFFSNRPESERLNKSDADVVHVIHTDGGTFGFLSACGTIDFFPNGGSSQPGCYKISVTDPTTIAETVMCDHHRSWKYFIEAVANPQKFQARKCSNWITYSAKFLCDNNEEVTMGDLQTTKTGQFYLETNSEPPFYKKKDGLESLFPGLRL